MQLSQINYQTSISVTSIDTRYGLLSDDTKSNKEFKEALSALQRGADINSEDKRVLNNNSTNIKNSVTMAKGITSADLLNQYTISQNKSQNIESKSDDLITSIQKIINRPRGEIEGVINKVLVDSQIEGLDEIDANEFFNPLEKESKNGFEIYDEVLGKSVYINLEDGVKESLIDKFGSLEASKEYVKQWYDDAAYSVGYLKADANKDGTISKDEAKDLKAMIITDFKSTTVNKSLNDIFQNPNDSDDFLNEFGYIDNINDFINNSIKSDVDKSGTITFGELAVSNLAQSVSTILKGSKDETLFELNRIIHNPSQPITAMYGKDDLNDELISTLFENEDEDIAYQTSKDAANRMLQRHLI
jgi:hypothetical protein